MAEPYVGEIRNFGFTYAPEGWAVCAGQLLSISQYADLFSLLGTTYGGDGHATFALPDLRGRVPINVGHGLGLRQYSMGQKAGSEEVTLTAQNLPAHSHDLMATTTEADTDVPSGGALANSRSNTYLSPTTSPVPALTVALKEGTITSAGDGESMENRQPYLTTNYCIAVKGMYPPLT